MKHLNGQDCRALLGSISDYLDGTLQDELCRELEGHLANCEDCQVVVDTLRKTIELVHTGSTEGLPEDIRLRPFKRLEIEDLFRAAGSVAGN
ncbi:MAG TPA: zf-HC2 domain-containing protein [Anaerolineales bacterium]